MKKNIILSIIILILVFIGACSKGKVEEKPSELIQPVKWWQVHPRPIYATLEKIGTFQSWFDVYKLAEDTYTIYEPNQFEEAICFLVLGKERGILIDTGTGIGNLKAVVDQLTSLPVSVLLTHEHYDHVAGAYHYPQIAAFNNAESLKVMKNGRDNASLLKYIGKDFLWKPLPPGWDGSKWAIPPIMPSKLLQEGEVVDLGERTLEVIYTPGHSPGSICLLDKKHRILFTGDHFFPGPLYAHAPDVNLDDYIKSNEKLVQRISEFDFLCSGHNDPWVKSEVLKRVTQAFQTIRQGKGNFKEKNGVRRYKFNGFDILIRSDMIK